MRYVVHENYLRIIDEEMPDVPLVEIHNDGDCVLFDMPTDKRSGFRRRLSQDDVAVIADWLTKWQVTA